MSDDNGPMIDPTIFCAAFKQHRFYLFTQREPDDSGAPFSRMC